MIRGFNLKLGSSKALTYLLAGLLIAILILSFCVITSIQSNNISYAETITVSNLDELKAALETANSKTTIIVSESITIIKDADEVVNLDGHGATITVPEPLIDFEGNVNNNASPFGVFRILNSNVNLKNMTIMGGGKLPNFDGYPAVYVNTGNVTMENVTITNSNGGYLAYAGTSVLKNCNIVRNVRSNAGGLYIGVDCVMVLDGCSLAENRSAISGKGGGAMEVTGTLYANNTIFANNSSSEMGGAINCYSGQLNLTNCAITGNVTTAGTVYGGGIGYNSNRRSTIINSVIVDNNFYSTYTNQMTRSDIGVFRSSSGDINLINCVYGVVEGSDVDAVSTTNCKIDTNYQTAAGYREDGIMYTRDNEHILTDNFKHPVLISKTIGTPELYAPVKRTNGKAASGGIKTYFDYSDMSDIKMGYGDVSSITTIAGTVAPDSSKQVDIYFEGDARVDGVIGPSKAIDATFYTVKLNPTANGRVSGASIYGDSYIAGTEATIKAIPNTGYALSYWSYNSKVKLENTLVLTIDADITLSAVFDVGYEITYNANGGIGTDSESYVVGSDITIKGSSDLDITRQGYNFIGWNTRADGTGTSYQQGDKYKLKGNVVLYAQWKEITVADVIDLINSLATIEYTPECKAKIDAARAAYNALDDNKKALITNYDLLTQAEATYAQLELEAAVAKNRLSGGAIAGIVIGAIVALLCCAYVLIFFAFNKFIIKDGKVVRAFILKNNYVSVNLITFKGEKEVRDIEQVFAKKKDAETILRNGD